MADQPKTLAEVLAERRAAMEGRTDEIDKAVEAADPVTSKKKKKKKPNVVTQQDEKKAAGGGRDFAQDNIRILMQQLDAQYDAAKRAGNVDLMNKIEARRTALKESG